MDGERALARRAVSLAQAALVAAGAALVAWLGAAADVYTLDGYYYLATAKSLAHGLGPVIPWNDGTEQRFFLGYSFALALPLRLFGEAGFWLLAAALHALTGLLLALILRRVKVRPPTAVGAVALAMFSPVALLWSTVPSPEPLLAALAAGALLCALRWRQGGSGANLILATALAGLAFFTRGGGLFVALAAAAIAWERLRGERPRWLLAACALALLAPGAAHLAWLGTHGTVWASLSSFFNQVRSHLGEVQPLRALVLHLSAAYRLVFRFDSEPWLYARFFPVWLTAAQALVLALYLVSMVAAVVSGFYKRGVAFRCVVGILVFSLAHAFWYEETERFDYLVVPAAAVVFAWAIDKLFFWARPRLRAALALALIGLCTVISGVYGARASRMHAERLVLQQGGRDFRAVAGAVNRLGLGDRPVVTDLGPHLAYYLDGRSYLDGDVRDYYADVVPEGAAGREFLASRRVGAVVSRRRAAEVEQALSLAEGEAREEKAPGTTLLLLALPPAQAGR